MGILDNYFGPLPSHFATAQYQPTPGAAFPDASSNAPPPAPLAIPPALPPSFPPPQAAPPTPPPGAWDSINNGLTNHALTLMALGGGIAQGGVGRGLTLAGQAAEAERSRQLQQLNFLQTYSALTNAGVPPEEARAALTNPSLMRTVAGRYIGQRSPANAASAPAAPPSAANSNPSPAPAPALNQPAASLQGNPASASAAAPTAPATTVKLPPMPPNLSNVAAYHPTLNLWRDRDGNIFGPTGNRVA